MRKSVYFSCIVYCPLVKLVKTSPSQGGVTGSIPVRVNMIESVTHLVTDFFIYITNLVKALRKGLIDAMMDLCK